VKAYGFIPGRVPDPPFFTPFTSLQTLLTTLHKRSNIIMSTHASDSQLANLSETLLNKSGSVPLSKRFRALFTLKALALSNEEVIHIISRGGV
jgi:hypothetical protein